LEELVKGTRKGDASIGGYVFPAGERGTSKAREMERVWVPRRTIELFPGIQGKNYSLTPGKITVRTNR